MVDREQWEYKVIWLRPFADTSRYGGSATPYTNQLNILGYKGWELVCVEKEMAYFKRKKG